jgi:hypothetical protein
MTYDASAMLQTISRYLQRLVRIGKIQFRIKQLIHSREQLGKPQARCLALK